MTDEEIKAKWLKKDRKIGRYVVLSFFGVLLALACVFWEYTIIIFWWFLSSINNRINRFHSYEGLYKCSETFELSNGQVIEDFYLNFERLSYSEYRNHMEQRDYKVIYIGPRDKKSYYYVTAYIRFSGEKDLQEYPVTMFYHPKNEVNARSGPITFDIEVNTDSYKTISIMCFPSDYELVPNKKYKYVLKSFVFNTLTTISSKTDENGNHEYEYIEKRFNLEYQGNIEWKK